MKRINDNYDNNKIYKNKRMNRRRDRRFRLNVSSKKRLATQGQIKGNYLTQGDGRSSLEQLTKYKSNLQANLLEFHKQRKFNRNIHYFRDCFHNNDSSQLPFMSSLRNIQKFKSLQQKNETISNPFQTSNKTTLNMKEKKSIFDIKGKGNRIINALYRFHNKSGMNSKQGTEFECSLRHSPQSKRKVQDRFINLVKPIKYSDTEEKVYNQKQLVCPHQKKLFRIK